MNLSLFRRLLQIAYDEQKETILRQLLVHFIIFSITFSLVVFGFQKIGMEKVMQYYIWVHFSIHLIFIFFTSAIIQSMDKMIAFMARTPVTATEVFYKVYLAASFNLPNGIEYGLILIVFFSFGGKISEVFTFIFILEAMRFARIFMEFLLAWLKTVGNVRLYISSIFFIGLVALLVSVKRDLLSWSGIDFSAILNLAVFGIVCMGLIAGPSLVNRLLVIQRTSPGLYISLTRRIGAICSKLTLFGSGTTLVQLQVMRMLRNSEYIGRYIRLCTIVVGLTLVNELLLPYQDTPTRTIIDLSYIVCMVSFITFQLDFSLIKHSYLEFQPVRMRYVHVIVDTIHGALLLLLALFMFILEIVCNKAAIGHGLDLLIAFGVFYFMSVGIPVPDTKVSGYQKWGYYFQFFFLSLPIKIAYQYHVLDNWYIQFLLLLFAGLLLYLRKYRTLD